MDVKQYIKLKIGKKMKQGTITMIVKIVIVLFIFPPALERDGERGQDARFHADVLGQEDSGVDGQPQGGAGGGHLPQRPIQPRRPGP